MRVIQSIPLALNINAHAGHGLSAAEHGIAFFRSSTPFSKYQSTSICAWMCAAAQTISTDYQNFSPKSTRLDLLQPLPISSFSTPRGCYIQGGRLHFQLANYRHPTIGKTEIIQARANPLKVLSHPWYDLIPGPKGTVQPTPVWERLLKALPQHAIIDYEDTHQEPRKSKPSDNYLIGNNDSVHKTLAEQLRELEQAKNDGLITEEEFQTLRTKLLNSY